jgi:GntR family transcriptional regulator
MTLQREAPDPLYLQLKDSLENQIRAGVYQKHQRLPSERELSEQFNVSRMTARHALLALVRDGAVYTRVGKGTFVAGPKIDQELQSLSGFSQDILGRGSRPSSRVLEARVAYPPPDAAAALGLVGNEQVIVLARLRRSDGIPLAVETAYLPASRMPDLLRHDFAVESLYEVVQQDYGLQLVHAEQRIEAGLASPRELELLEMTAPAAVLRMRRLTRDASGVPVEWVLSTYRGDRYAFRTMLSAAGMR